MNEHIRKVYRIRWQLAGGFDITTEHDGSSRELRIRLRQYKLLAPRRHLPRLLVLQDEIERVFPRGKLHVLPVENVVVKNLLVIVNRQIHVEVATEARNHLI